MTSLPPTGATAPTVLRTPSEGSLTPPHTPPTASPRTISGSEEFQAALLNATEAYKKANYAYVVSSCHQLYAIDSTRFDVFLLLGAAYYQLKDFPAAIAANDAAILLNPSCSEAYANLGNALYQTGSVDLAITYYSSAIRLNSNFIDAYINLARAYIHKYGDSGLAAAEKCYSVALEKDPCCGAAWRGLGDCAQAIGNFEAAVTNYKKAIEILPDSFEAHSGLGSCLRALQQLEEAEAAFAVASALRPNCPLTLGNLAGAYYDNRKIEASISAYRRAIALNPKFSEALNNLGNALRESCKPHEALACYLACIRIQLTALSATTAASAAANALVVAPGTPGRVAPVAIAAAPTAAAAVSIAIQRLCISYNNLGGILKILGRNLECIVAYEQVVRLEPTVPEGHANLGSSLKDAGRHEEALLSYGNALTLLPAFPEAFANLVHSMQCICDWRERGALFARLEKEVERDLEAGNLPRVQPFHALTYPFSPLLALKISQRYAAECIETVKRLPDAPTEPLFLKQQPRSSHQRLRVGYVSSDFVNHPLAHLMGSVFGLHDRSKIEVFCYSLSPSDGSEFHRRISVEAENFLDVSSWTSPAIARRIASDGINILFNLNGYTKGARNEIFAMRPAPLQVSLMGFPATMGANFIDWIVLDKMVCTEESRECYSESIAYMPDTYFVNDYKRSHPEVISVTTAVVADDQQGGGGDGGGTGEDDDDTASSPVTDATALGNTINTAIIRASLGLPEDKVVYSCSNQLYKFEPEIFTTWTNILKRVPNSVLWLLRFPPAGESRVRLEAAARGVDPNRVIFTDVASKPIHVARSGLADVFLDTPACNAHTTGCDVLWGGCPMVTLPLKRMASRVGASLCSATGLGEHMVVSSLQEYEERAVMLGLDHERRKALRDALHAQRKTCALFDTQRYVRNLDILVQKMWKIHCEGHGPRDFSIVEE